MKVKLKQTKRIRLVTASALLSLLPATALAQSSGTADDWTLNQTQSLLNSGQAPAASGLSFLDLPISDLVGVDAKHPLVVKYTDNGHNTVAQPVCIGEFSAGTSVMKYSISGDGLIILTHSANNSLGSDGSLMCAGGKTLRDFIEQLPGELEFSEPNGLNWQKISDNQVKLSNQGGI